MPRPNADDDGEATTDEVDEGDPAWASADWGMGGPGLKSKENGENAVGDTGDMGIAAMR